VHIHIAAKERRDCTLWPTMRKSPAFLYVLAGNGIDLLELSKHFLTVASAKGVFQTLLDPKPN